MVLFLSILDSQKLTKDVILNVIEWFKICQVFFLYKLVKTFGLIWSSGILNLFDSKEKVFIENIRI